MFHLFDLVKMMSRSSAKHESTIIVSFLYEYDFYMNGSEAVYSILLSDYFGTNEGYSKKN